MKRRINACEELALLERLAVSNARCAALLHALTGVLGVVEKIGGYMEHRDQLAVRGARAMIADYQRLQLVTLTNGSRDSR